MSDETPPTIEELTKQIEDTKAQEASRIQQLQMQSQNLQQQLQSASAAVINTKGQIKQLEEILVDQTREWHQLEGMMRAIQMSLQR